MPETNTRLNLVVLYTDDVKRLRDELSVFGLTFEQHQHGSGPVHFASEMDGCCLEIYPASDTNPTTQTRIGLRVNDINQAMESAQAVNAVVKVEPKPSPWGTRAVIHLQSGMKVELVQPNGN